MTRAAAHFAFGVGEPQVLFAGFFGRTSSSSSSSECDGGGVPASALSARVAGALK